MKNQYSLKSLFIKNFALLLTASCLFFNNSCQTNVAEPLYIGYEYFGQNTGSWIVYNVDSTVYDDFLGQVFRYQYQVMEVKKELFINDAGKETMLLERYWRNNPDENWKIKNMWTSRIEDKKALRTEENMTYVKLSFPLSRNKTWNGNAYNNKISQNYRITDIHNPEAFGNLEFDSTLRVLQKDFTTLIGEELQYEIYAAGVGLVEKKFVELQKEIDGTIIRGVRYSYIIDDFNR